MATKVGNAPVLVRNPEIDGSPVCIARGLDHRETVLEALRGCGGLDGLVKPGCTVLIKPNLVGPAVSGGGRITDWRVVQALVSECNRLGAGTVLVAECPVEGNWEKDFRVSGYLGISDAALVNPNIDVPGCIHALPERSLSGVGFHLPKEYLDADVVISAPVMKTHFTAGVTLGLKNIGIGIPPLAVYGKGGFKAKLHELGINRVIPDVCSIRPPDLTVIDGMVGGEGEGPTDPTPVHMGLIIAGRDPLAVDATCARLMGIDPGEVTHLVYAHEAGLGDIDADRIRVTGVDPSECIHQFKRPPNRGYPIKRTTVIRHVPEGFTNPRSAMLWEKGRHETIRGADGRGPICGFALLHDYANLYVALVPEVPLERVDVLLSLDMPFEEDVNAGRHIRVEGLDYIVSAAVGKGALPGVLKRGADELAGSAVLPGTGGVDTLIKLPLSCLGRRDLLPRQELWVDVGVKPRDAVSSALWSGAAHLGHYTDPTTAGRALVTPW